MQWTPLENCPNNMFHFLSFESNRPSKRYWTDVYMVLSHTHTHTQHALNLLFTFQTVVLKLNPNPQKRRKLDKRLSLHRTYVNRTTLIINNNLSTVALISKNNTYSNFLHEIGLCVGESSRNRNQTGKNQRLYIYIYICASVINVSVIFKDTFRFVNALVLVL